MLPAELELAITAHIFYCYYVDLIEQYTDITPKFWIVCTVILFK